MFLAVSAQNFNSMNNMFTSFANSYIVGLAYWLLPIIGYWFLFEKKGEPGWKNLIPFYGSYMRFKLFFNTGKWWRQFFASVLFFIALIGLFVGLVMFNANRLSDRAAYTCIASFVVMFIAIIWMIVIEIQYDISICKVYGRGFWFTLGMILMHPLFVGVLAYEVHKGRAKEVEKNND